MTLLVKENYHSMYWSYFSSTLSMDHTRMNLINFSRPFSGSMWQNELFLKQHWPKHAWSSNTKLLLKWIWIWSTISKKPSNPKRALVSDYWQSTLPQSLYPLPKIFPGTSASGRPGWDHHHPSPGCHNYLTSWIRLPSMRSSHPKRRVNANWPHSIYLKLCRVI